MADLIQVGRQVGHYGAVAAGSLGIGGGRALAGPIHVQIGICDPCNHRCVMCWDHPPEDRESAATADRFGGAKEGLMSLEMFRGIVSDLADLGTRRVDLVGRGEPLLNPAAVEMVRYVKSRGMMAILCTNASRLTSDRAAAFVEAGLDRLNVSLNAGTPDTYPSIHVTESPESYRSILENLSRLAGHRRAADSQLPHTRLSFVISSRNHFELDEMLEVTAAVGAHEAMFVHTVVHDGTRDLAIGQPEYERLIAKMPALLATARRLGIRTNLKTFGATVPTYMDATVKGPAVVPCYVGWYFSNVLANGSVLPCCQCAAPIGRVTAGRRFRDIWASSTYSRFRRDARGLPTPSDVLSSCECDRCMLRPRNVSLHNFLHPFDRIAIGEKQQLFGVGDLLRLGKVDD